jgi:hypothetical protein
MIFIGLVFLTSHSIAAETNQVPEKPQAAEQSDWSVFEPGSSVTFSIYQGDVERFKRGEPGDEQIKKVLQAYLDPHWMHAKASAIEVFDPTEDTEGVLLGSNVSVSSTPTSLGFRLIETETAGLKVGRSTVACEKLTYQCETDLAKEVLVLYIAKRVPQIFARDIEARSHVRGPDYQIRLPEGTVGWDYHFDRKPGFQDDNLVRTSLQQGRLINHNASIKVDGKKLRCIVEQTQYTTNLYSTPLVSTKWLSDKVPGGLVRLAVGHPNDPFEQVSHAEILVEFDATPATNKEAREAEWQRNIDKQ